MTEEEFWALIVATDPAADDSEVLTARLAVLPDEELRDFEVTLNRLLDAAYRGDLWDAAYLINDGCSDDGFEYFRCRLVAQGPSVYAEALRDPDSLAGHPAVIADQDHYECESLLYAAGQAYAARTGLDPARFYDRCDTSSPGAKTLLIDHARDHAELVRRLPRLTALLLDG
ncbi:DUF4240 domain-containing protein [Actinomadura viridis]|uniref:DUF4240 domain-containing protein n=1 Tax=Actinomadura viridis TaxID=58110 RepID=UPI0036BA025F